MALLGSWQFDRIALGGGGLCTGAVANDLGTLFWRTDTFGSHYRKIGEAKCTQFLRPGDNVADSEFLGHYTEPVFGYGRGPGAYAVAIAKDTDARMLSCELGHVWWTKDGGATVAKSDLPWNANYAANGSYRHTGPRMAYDPANNDIAFFGGPHGLFETLDGGETWGTAHADIPAEVGTDYQGIFVCFDENSTVSGTPSRTQRIIVFSPGNGVYESTNGGADFSLIASSPTDCIHLKVNPHNGDIFCAGNKANTAKISRYNGSWTTPTIAQMDSVRTVVFDPDDATAVYAFNSGEGCSSSDSGATWGSDIDYSRDGGNMPWMGWTLELSMTTGDVIYRPVAGNFIHVAGIGVWEGSAHSPGMTAITWTNISEGFDQLCTMEMGVTPNGVLQGSFLDRAFFAWDRDGIFDYPTRHGPNNLSALQHGGSQDWAIDNENFLVGAKLGGNVLYSTTNNWQTSTEVAVAPPEGGSGEIAVSTTLNWVYVPGLQNPPSYTLDAGATWNAVDLGGIDLNLVHWHNSYNHQRRIVVADKSNAGHFYLVAIGNPSEAVADAAVKGVWKTTNGGVNWTRIFTGNITSYGRDFWNCKLKMPLAHSPNLFWAVGDESGQGGAPSTTDLMFSEDGTSWAGIGFDEAMDVAFGKAAPGASYMAIIVKGWRSGEYGLWHCEDFNPASPNSATWTKVATFPDYHYDPGTTLAGDPNQYGRFYHGGGGSGIVAMRRLISGTAS